MASKDILLKKRLIRNGILLSVALGILGPSMYALSNFGDNMQAEKDAKASAFGAARAEFSAIDTLLKNGTEIDSEYNAYVLSHNSDFNIRRDAATQTLSRLREKFHLATLEVSIEHIEEIQPDFIQMKSGALLKSAIKLKFTALTDNSVFGFIEALHHELPGIAVISGIKITRDADVSRSILVDLSQHKITPMVSGELSFIWMGIRPRADQSGSALSGKGAQNGK